MKLFFSPIRFFVLLVLLSVLAGCNELEAKTVEVAIYKMAFTPNVVNIKQGDTVVWTNMEKRQYHNVWFEESGDEEPEYMFPEDTYSKTFDSAGSFNYRCGPHPKMIGVVNVE